MRSARFGKEIVITHHARERVAERGIDEDLLLDLIETGYMRRQELRRLFLYKNYAERSDNALCAAVALEASLVVMTVMINWTLREAP